MPSFVSAVGDQKPQEDCPLTHSCLASNHLSVKSSPKPLKRANLLPPYRGKFRHSRPYSQGQAQCRPALTLPSPQRCFPSFSDLVAKGLGSDNTQQSPSGNAAQQEFTARTGTKTDSVAWSDSAGQRSLSQAGSIVARTSQSNGLKLGPPLGRTHISSTTIHARSHSLTQASQGDLPQTKTSSYHIDPEALRIERVPRSRMGRQSHEHAIYSVQIQDHAGEPTSKAQQIQIYTVELPAPTGPRLHIRVYHDPVNPHHFPSVSATGGLWLTCKLHCSKKILEASEQGFTPTLASSLRSSTGRYEARLRAWNFDQRDQKVLELALNKIGEGDPSGPLDRQPWQYFLTSCRAWGRAGEWTRHKALDANRKRSTHRP